MYSTTSPGRSTISTSPEHQRILLKLAFFPRLTAELAVAATGDEQARPLLEYLYHRHLFVERRTAAAWQAPPSRCISFTRCSGRSCAGRPQRHTRVKSCWTIASTTALLLRRRGQIDDAFPLYAEAEDWEGAADLIHQHADSYLRQGRRQLLSDWIARLPSRSGIPIRGCCTGPAPRR